LFDLVNAVGLFYTDDVDAIDLLEIFDITFDLPDELCAGVTVDVGSSPPPGCQVFRTAGTFDLEVFDILECLSLAPILGDSKDVGEILTLCNGSFAIPMIKPDLSLVFGGTIPPKIDQFINGVRIPIFDPNGPFPPDLRNSGFNILQDWTYDNGLGGQDIPNINGISGPPLQLTKGLADCLFRGPETTQIPGDFTNLQCDGIDVFNDFRGPIPTTETTVSWDALGSPDAFVGFFAGTETFDPESTLVNFSETCLVCEANDLLQEALAKGPGGGITASRTFSAAEMSELPQVMNAQIPFEDQFEGLFIGRGQTTVVTPSGPAGSPLRLESLNQVLFESFQSTVPNFEVTALGKGSPIRTTDGAGRTLDSETTNDTLRESLRRRQMIREFQRRAMLCFARQMMSAR
jgi:hypothetical protein